MTRSIRPKLKDYHMKIFFKLSILFSIVLGINSLQTSLVGQAHNQYRSRNLLLNDPSRDSLAMWWELTEAEVSAQPERFARAYRASVTDANKLGRLVDRLEAQCVFIAVVLFIVSFAGLVVSEGKTRPKDSTQGA